MTSIAFPSRLLLLSVSAATLLAFAVPGGAQEPKAEHSEPAPASVPAPPTPNGGPPPGEFVIGAGDVLHVFIWKEPDLTRNVTVRLDGRITVWLDDAAPEGHPSTYDLCRRHANSLCVPMGWQLRDRRNLVPAIGADAKAS